MKWQDKAEESAKRCPAPSLCSANLQPHIAYESYGQQQNPPEAWTLNTGLREHGFGIHGIFHEMLITRKQNGGQNTNTMSANKPFVNT